MATKEKESGDEPKPSKQQPTMKIDAALLAKLENLRTEFKLQSGRGYSLSDVVQSLLLEHEQRGVKTVEVPEDIIVGLSEEDATLLRKFVRLIAVEAEDVIVQHALTAIRIAVEGFGKRTD